MIIQKIEIQNFRSYYKENSFELIDGFNLIIGSNGDGKTTFYEALEWLFRTDGSNKMDTKYISKKRSEELMPDDSDDVRVAMVYEHNGKIKTLEKMFHFTKSFDGEVGTSNYSFSLIEGNGVERITVDGVRFDKDLPSEMRKFIMFKGEADLDVLQSSNAMKLLVDNFSEVRDFDAYFEFMEYATRNANKARDNAQKLDKKNQDRIKDLNRTIEHEKGLLSDIEREIGIKENEAESFDKLLKNIEQSQESSKMLVSVNSRIENLQKLRSETVSRIREDYTINLLDDMWVLMGFENTADEYSTKVNELMKERRRLENQYLVTTGEEKAIKAIQKGITDLPAHIPGRKIMEDMLKEEKCKFCGQAAPRGSDAWNFMLARLEEYKASLNTQKADDIEPYYQNNYIGELQKRDTTLNDNLSDITTMRHKIQELMAFNNRLHDDVKKIDANLENEFEQKKRILAQTDGLTEEQLLANYESISTWMDKKNRADNRVDILKRQREQHREILEKAQLDLSKISEGTAAAMYAKTALILQQISDSFKNAKELNKKNLLFEIEDWANILLARLCPNTYTGTIKFAERTSGQGEIFLVDSNCRRLFNPGYSLRKACILAVMLVIIKLCEEREKSNYPLIAEGSFDQFEEVNGNRFFDSCNGQMIVITGDYFRLSVDGKIVLDSERLKTMCETLYRIEKRRPFDAKKLGTLQTIVTRIN